MPVRTRSTIDSFSGDRSAPAENHTSATGDYRNFFLLRAAYLVKSELTVNVVDRQTGETIASHSLLSTSRDGDQGFTDVSAASARQVVEDASFGFTVLLRRGGDYRVEMELEAMAQVLVVGAVEVDARADWNSITVRVDEDEIDALAEHDAAVLSAIAAHDAAISARSRIAWGRLSTRLLATTAPPLRQALGDFGAKLGPVLLGQR